MHQEKRITNVADLKVVLEQDADMLGPLVAGLMQKIFKPEMIEYLMAAKGERTGARQGYRNARYSWTLLTRVRKLEL
ncbi:MAG TPA: transposase [Candidatus Hydrogenedentes bacterium]|nr:transposase [Candidatus Hydrogenedentota bacterium]HQM51280.1 transposase [Candidatus Hydrogenedentota bacterium]